MRSINTMHLPRPVQRCSQCSPAVLCTFCFLRLLSTPPRLLSQAQSPYSYDIAPYFVRFFTFHFGFHWSFVCPFVFLTLPFCLSRLCMDCALRRN